MGKTTLAKLEVAHRLARAASESTDRAEWIAEAEAKFCYTERYCVCNARKYAAYAVIAATAVVIEWESRPWYRSKTARSHAWAAAARSNMAMACVFEYFRCPEKESIDTLAMLASNSAYAAEKRAQAVLLRSLFEYPSRITGPAGA